MKKRSALGIIISVIMSILLIPLIWAAGVSGTTMMTISSVFKEERKDEIFQTFMDNKGSEWIYSFVEPMIREISTEYSEELPGSEVIFEDVLTEQDVKTILEEFYVSAVNGKIYEFDLTFVADRLKENIETFYDNEAANYVEENLETIYESLDAETKEEIKAEAKKIVLAEVEKEFDAQIDEIVEEEVNKYIEENYPNVPEELVAEKKAEYLAEHKDEIVAEAKAEVMTEAENTFDAEADAYIRENIRELYAQIDEETKQELHAQVKEEYLTEYFETVDESVASVEAEANTSIQEIYASEEYQQLEQTQKEYEINIYDFDFLHEIFETAGYICFIIAAVILVILLLCYLFRPAGFFVSGIFVLMLGGGIKVVSGYVLPVANEMIATNVELPHESVGAMINTALTWVTEGMEKSAMIGIFAGAVLVLLGVLMLIIRRNKEA